MSCIIATDWMILRASLILCPRSVSPIFVSAVPKASARRGDGELDSAFCADGFGDECKL